MARPGTSEAVSRSSRPRVLLVGGPDVDARLELMGRLTDAFELGAVGSEPALASRFAAEGYAYEHYDLSRRMSPVSDLLAFRQLVAIFRRRKPHIVHAFDTKPGVWAPMAARLAGVPVVLATSTGLGSLYGSDRWRTRLAWWTYVRLQTLACRMTDLMIFQNHDDARHFVAEGIVSGEKTQVVPGSGVSPRGDAETPSGSTR